MKGMRVTVKYKRSEGASQQVVALSVRGVIDTIDNSNKTPTETAYSLEYDPHLSPQKVYGKQEGRSASLLSTSSTTNV